MHMDMHTDMDTRMGCVAYEGVDARPVVRDDAIGVVRAVAVDVLDGLRERRDTLDLRWWGAAGRQPGGRGASRGAGSRRE